MPNSPLSPALKAQIAERASDFNPFAESFTAFGEDCAQLALAAQADEITDWMLMAEGIKHDVRCGNHFMGDERWGTCLRCQRDAAEATVREQAAQIARLQAEVCICAAIRLDDGEVFRGHRHNDAIRTAGNAGVERARIHRAEQGFITSRNRFVGREEGAALQRAAGIVSAQTGALPEGMLFSEDLYLRPKASA